MSTWLINELASVFEEMDVTLFGFSEHAVLAEAQMAVLNK